MPKITEVEWGILPMSGRTASGYGGALPTHYLVRIDTDKVWRRVRVMCYGNASTPYITVAGKMHTFDLVEPGAELRLIGGQS